MPAISYQLYSSRNFPDLARQCRMLAGLGLKHVEPFGGLFGDIAPLRDAMAENGLTAPTAHVGAPALREDFDGTVAKLKALGIETAIVPAVPPAERVQDRAGWQRLGQELAGWAKRAADQGLRFGWHNHHFEFARLDGGSMPLEWILGEEPSLLWQVDIAWVMRGEQDPVAWIERYKPRVTSFHVKDLAPAGQNADEDGWADVGYGVVDWAKLLPVMRATPATVWTLEHDNPLDDERFATRSFATVSGW
ncbi:MAG TPA: sugar phosphate isomerase/epimerase [Acetobacteraceae bacterium]